MDKFKGKWNKFRKPYGPSLSGSSASTANSSISLAQNSNSQISTPSLPATSQPQLKSSSSSVQSCALVADIPSQTTGSLSDIQFLSPSSTSRPCTPSLVTNNRIPPPLAAAATPAVQAPANDAALSIWDEAFSKVNDETQRWIRDYGLNLNSSEQAKSEDQIKELTDLLKSKTLFEDRNVPSKIEIGNQMIIFREYIADIVAFLTVAGDIAINFAPPQASAPWAAAKAVLNIPVKRIEQMAALAGTLQWFIRIVRRGQVYEHLYHATSTDIEAVSNLHDALLDLYISAMELLARSDVLFGSDMIKQTLNEILRPQQASGLVSDLLKKEQRVSLEVQACEASRNAKAGVKLDEKAEGMLNSLNKLLLPLTRVDKGVVKLLEKVEEGQRESLMEFISAEQFGKGHAAIKDTRTENTGDWLLNHEGFRDWQAITSSSTLLCLKGTVGTGKTYLTSRVIDHVKETLESSAHDEGFAFFYCSRSGPSMQDPLVILRSFVRQLSYKAYDYDRVQKNIIKAFKLAKKEGRDLSYRDCKELILDSMNLYSKTTIIIDALDESDITVYNLAEILIELIEIATKPVKVFISSRPDREYLEAFKQDGSTITVDSSSQQGDIEKFLNENLYSKPFFRKRHKDIQVLIKETFESRSGGMFRWVYLQVKGLMACISDDAIRKWAETMPRDLMGAYDQIWENIKEHRDAYDIALAERAIKWVLCSFHPLKSETFLEAIRFVIEGDTMVEKEKQSEQQILSLCQDLLTIDIERQVWMLPHASVAEYFESRDMILGKCDAFASHISIHFLLKSRLEPTQHGSKDDRPNSFEHYVTHFWFKHIQRYDQWLGSTFGEDAELNLVKALERFLGSPEESSEYYKKWVDSLDDKWILLDGNWIHTKKLTPNNTPLLTICRYGFYYILRDWWDQHKINNEVAPRRYRLLELAAEGGCMPIFRYLLSMVDLNSDPAEQLDQAIKAAIESEHKDIISLLIGERKVDINISYQWTNSPVEVAVEFPDLLQWLVDQGWVDANAKGGSEYRTPLIASASNGVLQSAKILLQAGADVNAFVKSGPYGSALVAAANSMSTRKTEMIQFLIDNGADVNPPPLINGKSNKLVRSYGSALEALMIEVFWAIKRRNRLAKEKKSLRLLLKAGADPAMALAWGEHGSAFAAAAFHGLKDFFDMMIRTTGRDRAIESLGCGRYPGWMLFSTKEEVERWKERRAETRAYLVNRVRVDKRILYKIGLPKVDPEEIEDGDYCRINLPKVNDEEMNSEAYWKEMDDEEMDEKDLNDKELDNEHIDEEDTDEEDTYEEDTDREETERRG